MEHKELPPQLRQHFFGHVIGPIGHHSVVTSIDDASQALSSNITNPLLFQNLFTGLVERDMLNPQRALSAFADGIRRGFTFSSSRVYDNSKFPLTQQQIHMLRFLQGGKRPLWFKEDETFRVKKEGLFTIEGTSVVRALQDISTRTDGLEVSSLAGFIAMAQRPEVLDVFRALMSGGPDFDSFIRSKPGEPVPSTFRFFQTQEADIAFLDDDGIVKVNPWVKELARKYRRLYDDNVEVTVSEEKFEGNAAGCPLKGLTFLQHTPLLDEYGVALTDEQIEVLTGGENPTASRRTSDQNVPGGSENIYQIRRDGLQEMLDMCVEQMFVVIDAIEDQLVLHPDNEYLIGNVGLLIGEPFKPGELRSIIERQIDTISRSVPQSGQQDVSRGISLERCPVAH